MTALAALLLPLGVARAESVTVRIRDQAAAQIAGSKLVIQGVGTFDTGQTVTLSPGSYNFDLFPAVAGFSQLTHLFRREAVVITSGQTSLDFEWITANVTIQLRDQHGATIPGSRATIVGTGLGYPAVPLQVVLPITDPSVYPTVAGLHSEGGNKGYDIQLVPGIEAQPITFLSLLRSPGSGSSLESVQVHAGTTELDFRWITQEVTFRLQDQFGAAIPGSRILIYGSQPLGVRELPLTTTLPITDVSVYPDLSGSESERTVGGHGYGILLLPGILGEYAGGYLQREEGVHAGHEVPVHTDTTVITFEWTTTTLTIDLRDQGGASIPASEVFLYPAPTSGYHATPFTCTLPISDRSAYPTMIAVGAAEGPGSNGYDIQLVPGIEGQTQRSMAGSPLVVYRTVGHTHPLDEHVQVHAGQTQLNFQWITTTLTVDLRDQFGVSIPGSRVRMANFVRAGNTPGQDFRAVPFVITLPISDRLTYPSIGGPAAEGATRGYDLLLHPGLDGQPQYPCCGDLLLRYPGTETNPTSEEVRVHAGQTTLIYEWIAVACAIQVATTQGTLLPGSSLLFPSPFLAHSPASVVYMPITDNSVYPNIQGAYVNGYPIRVTPQDIAPLAGTFEFEVVPGGALLPASFSIAGQNYGLFCGTNRPPVADAGPNRTIFTSEQSTTVLAGTGTDPDPNPLTYRWLEGAAVLAGPASVGALGAAPLALGGLAPLSIGAHFLTLEVSDGQLTATSQMTLTIGNSPPSVSCGGGGTFEAGIGIVALTGVVADFDGDSVSWSWGEGGNVLGSGVAGTPVGGAPVAIPTIFPTTGPTGQLGVGTHVLRLTATDGVNPPQTCDVAVIVVDTRAPVLAPTSNCQMLWPPNHQMVDIVIQANASDPSGGPVLLSATVTSSEDPDKDGDGHTVPDWTEPVVNQGTGAITLQLRAERSGKGPGRTYTVTIRAVDLAGNVSTANVTCVAPHDMRRQ